jgi:hypothetical protein
MDHEKFSNLIAHVRQLPKGWKFRTRTLTEDLVLDLGPDKTIYVVKKGNERRGQKVLLDDMERSMTRCLGCAPRSRRTLGLQSIYPLPS